MATVKISNLRPIPTSIKSEEEFIGAVSNAVLRALDARLQENIKGGSTLPKEAIICGGLIPQLPPSIS